MHPEQLAALANSHRAEQERAVAIAARLTRRRRMNPRAHATRARHAAGWRLVELGLRLAVQRNEAPDALTSR